MPTLTLTHEGRPVELLDVHPVGLPASHLVADIRYMDATLPISVDVAEVKIEYRETDEP